MIKITGIIALLVLILLSGCTPGNGVAENNDAAEIIENDDQNDVESDNDIDLPEGWEMVVSGEQSIVSGTVTEKLNIREDVTVEEVENFLTTHADYLKEQYPDHSIIIEAYQDDELVAEIELE